MTPAKLILVCTRCSLRIRNLDPADIPPRGIVCRCGHRIQPGEARPDPLPRRSWPTEGPGTELKALLASLQLQVQQTCQCEQRARQMNAWGVAGCRARFAEIRAWLQDARTQTTWRHHLHAALAATTSGLVLHLDPTDLEGSILRLAIERAAAKADVTL